MASPTATDTLLLLLDTIGTVGWSSSMPESPVHGDCWAVGLNGLWKSAAPVSHLSLEMQRVDCAGSRHKGR